MGLDLSHPMSAPWRNGPSLTYMTEGPDPVMTVVDRADFASMDGRDRAICRALLEYTLKRLDKAEEADV